MGQSEETQRIVREKIAGASRIAVLTGAGISAESGVPTFRGDGGLWESHRAEDLATPEAFALDPGLVWRWYHWRRGLIAKCAPNPAHLALARLQQKCPDFNLITQNVDGLHKAAGSKGPLELHGSIWDLKCTACDYIEENRVLDLPELPGCPVCGGLLRPGVVWFGEQLDEACLERAWQAASHCQVMLVVGTSAVVQPAASLALAAKKGGAFVIEINPDQTPYTGILDAHISAKAGVALPGLVD